MELRACGNALPTRFWINRIYFLAFSFTHFSACPITLFADSPQALYLTPLCSFGSPQEFVEGGILRGFRDFLKSDVFGVGHGHTLRFQ
jgi:hypothetical protein